MQPKHRDSDEINSTDGGSDTDTQSEELTTHSSNTEGESEYFDCEIPASTGMTGDVTINNDHYNTVILNGQTLPKVVNY
jgi:plastocyanin